MDENHDKSANHNIFLWLLHAGSWADLCLLAGFRSTDPPSAVSDSDLVRVGGMAIPAIGPLPVTVPVPSRMVKKLIHPCGIKKNQVFQRG